MNLVVKICGVVLLVLIPMILGLIASRVLGWLMSKVRMYEASK